MRTIAIIPAFNEEKTIGSVLSVLMTMPLIDEVIVVNDGSSDKTSDVARRFNVTLIDLSENRGKGGAIKAGLDRSSADVVLFLDADLVGLSKEHVDSILKPVLAGEADMSLGLFEHGRVTTDLAQKVAPYLTGQRAIRREVLEKVNDLDVSRFGVELAITKVVDAEKLTVREVHLRDLTHVTKEEKLGVIKGFAARMKMYWEIVRYFTKADHPR